VPVADEPTVAATPESNGEEGLAEGPEGDRPMSFFDHLAELRTRLVRAALGVTAAFVVCYVFVDELTVVVTKPFNDAWRAAKANYPDLLGERPELQNLAALDAFLTDIRIAVFAAIFVAAPIIFYQLWMFVAPGLYAREKRLVVPFVATSAAMFVTGAVFCYLLVLPIATTFFIEYPLKKTAEDGVLIVTAYTYPDYVAYVTKILLGFGLMFEMPLAVFFLAKAGIVTHRTLLRHWKISVLLITITSAILTPPDPITIFLMGLPMIGLFFASIGVAYVVGKPEREALARLSQTGAVDDDDEA
jgi:sec-independent protein translocase protein TatC